MIYYEWVRNYLIERVFYGGRTMEKYDCKKCKYNTGGVFNRNKKCEHCTVDSKDLKGKPSCFKEKQQ